MQRIIALVLSLFAAWPVQAYTVNGQLKNAYFERRASDPSTTGEGRFYYNSGTKKPKYYNGTSWTEIGSGSGAGEKNYNTNPSAATDTTGYTATEVAGAGTITVTRTATAANLPREITTATGISFAAGDATDYVKYCFTIDDADKSKVLKLRWDQKPASYTAGDFKVEVYSFTSASCGGSATELTLSTDVASTGNSLIPNYEGEYLTTFSTTTADYYGVRWVRVSGSSTLVISDVVVGPGNVVKGPHEQYLGALTFPAVSGAGSKTWTVHNKCWRRTNLLRCTFALEGNATAAGTATDTFILNLPSGYTIDSTALSYTSSTTTSLNYLGTANTVSVESSGNYGDAIQILAASTTGLRFTRPGTGIPYRTTDFNAARAMDIEGEFEIPIAEWAVSGVNMAGDPSVEYAATSGTWNANSTTTVYGPAGATMGGALTDSREKTVTWRYPIRATDDIELQVAPIAGVDMWVPATMIYTVEWGTDIDASTGSGIVINNGTATTTTVQFYRYRVKSADNDVFDWDSTTRWRLRKISDYAGNIGYKDASSTEGGLVNSSSQTFGGRKSAGNSKVRVTMSATQSPTAGEVVQLAFNTEAFDTNSEFASNRFTPTRSGYYRVTVSARLNSLGDGKSFNLGIRKNGSTVARTQVYGSIAGADWVINANDIVSMNGSGDYLDFTVENGDSTTRTINNNSYDTYVAIEELL